jgi:hypothetical protein
MNRMPSKYYSSEKEGVWLGKNQEGRGVTIKMASVGQATAQNAQPMQFFSSVSAATRWLLPLIRSTRLKTEVGQTSMQAPQATQRGSNTAGCGQRERVVWVQTSPSGSTTAAKGQIRPQAPQSMQTSPVMICIDLRSPWMASTGQTFTQAVQPVHSVLMV